MPFMQTFTLTVSPQEFQLIWAALGKLPAENSRGLMNKLEAVVTQQEAATAGGPPDAAAAT